MNQVESKSSALGDEPRGGSGEMFDRIADRYDLLNRIISLGIDQGWRRKTVRALALKGDAQVLDLATGTGDLGILVAETHPEVEVVGLDPSAGMLEVGRQKVHDHDLTGRIRMVQGRAEELHFDDDQFDGVCMAFGIRNAEDRGKALREMARVTRPGGRIAILELSEPRGVLGPLARFHVHQVVPRLGAWLSGAKEYRYLEKSIAAFPPAEEFAALMRESNLEVLQVQPLTFGVCHLYVATPKVAEAD
ncbi:MAG: bifunctional demethylmenaquinone methyltransferase/2-methoxy-6-polyprenyl-1,4-benzoquinol methylase UbiE [Polyangiaceae bacterium]|nr:bifunctional demethylmenaquinone methyltransferase/2-methoxy-6-polyprenyl-1,4-benzoquinol methylase UbiE [Myxococcales bacterium]MCB9587849.1 bifunctional demethylmenaquinone methyltransferase/2-methoxy-6-polyprenyl-1,4-benzoquinol methylase UbiE [Polyangiaceae bacterium]MCB9608798.1 bifunctional demethylmenaquinone methyltransferase/2-methoxy-6-polyprenyl-1,4-benzoquinol methylase UbiE [Polyangiaceae bacterium]